MAPQLAARLRRQLDVLNRAMTTADLNLPGYRLHQLKGDRAGTWSITVSGNWALRSHSKVKMLSTWTSKIIIEDTHYGEHLVE